MISTILHLLEARLIQSKICTNTPQGNERKDIGQTEVAHMFTPSVYPGMPSTFVLQYALQECTSQDSNTDEAYNKMF